MCFCGLELFHQLWDFWPDTASHSWLICFYTRLNVVGFMDHYKLLCRPHFGNHCTRLKLSLTRNDFCKKRQQAVYKIKLGSSFSEYFNRCFIIKTFIWWLFHVYTVYIILTDITKIWLTIIKKHLTTTSLKQSNCL